MILLGIVVPTLASALFELALWQFFDPKPHPAEVAGRILLMLVASTFFTGFMLTLQKRAQRATERQRGKFRDLFLNAPDAILILDQQNLVQEMNPRAFQLLGYSPPMGPFPLHRLGDDLNLEQSLFETSVRRLDGRWLTVSASVSRLPQETMLRLSDLTQHKAEEEARLSRKLAWRAMQAQEEERRRLARELHDGVAQGLYSLRLANSTGQPLGEMLTSLMEEVDQLAKSLWPPVLERLGLGMALQTTLKQVATVHCQEINPRLEPAREAALFRIAQEAVNNAVRHGQASLIRVNLFKTPQAVVLEIQDNGQGFELETHSQGLGLLSMRERAQSAQGQFKLESSPGQGTRIEVSLP